MYIPFKENILSLFFFFTITVFSIVTSSLPFCPSPPPHHHCHDLFKVAIIFIVTIIVSGSILCVLIFTNLFCRQ